MAGDAKRRAHEVIYRALGCCIETMDLPATYKAAVTVRILMDLEAAGIGVHEEERQGGGAGRLPLHRP